MILLIHLILTKQVLKFTLKPKNLMIKNLARFIFFSVINVVFVLPLAIVLMILTKYKQ